MDLKLPGIYRWDHRLQLRLIIVFMQYAPTWNVRHALRTSPLQTIIECLYTRRLALYIIMLHTALNVQWILVHSDFLPSTISTLESHTFPSHPVHASELWCPVVLMSLSSPSTASPRCDGETSSFISSAVGPMLVCLSCSRQITVAGGLLSCIGDPGFLGGVC